MAGHSKWAQIKHKKGTTDAKRGQLFSKLVKEITIAAREAGPNPDANPRLRAACERARAEGLPKDNMERAIARAAGRGEGADLSEFLYEASAPGGTPLLIEGITDNKNRTVNEIKHLLTLHGGRMADPGSLIWNFEKIGMIACTPPSHVPQETSEMAVIDSGARDFAVGEDGVWLVETDYSARESVCAALRAAGFAIRDTGHDYKAKSLVPPAVGAEAKINALMEALADHNDVQDVYSNLRR